MSDPSAPLRPSAVPTGRIARLTRLGGLATGLAGRAAYGRAAAALRGQSPDMAALLLTPANVTRITERLSEMRGATMKLGQLLSMESGDVLPPELAAILARLRADADAMPPKQLKTVLATVYGSDFRHKFKSFNPQPLAAASIGQVHRATAADGMRLALKLQYPGVRDSIDSDLDNAAALIRWSGLWPRELDIAPLMREARLQLHEEADYTREGTYLQRFGDLLKEDARFIVPEHRPDLSTRDALAMSFEQSAPIEALADAAPATRDGAAHALIELCLRELFVFHVMQTDPNFANYQWRAETEQIVLLDFGAARDIPQDLADGHMRLLRAGLGGMRSDILAALEDIGFIKPGLSDAHRDAILDMSELGFGALRGAEPFDFATSTLADQLRHRGQVIGQERELWHIPPADTLFLQRKIGGLYLLATRLGARVDLPAIARSFAA
ncbi:ABC1 kinase family protein [Jannaschia sp. CCS1]|uniref:ABC1 kinase family protein n=1 Tax=Jannaschia sp. (strain CCS1) TaxID=290400 RepID=UPI000053C293|nr:AarF/ABC1/UbiB kinase family protein [Jannaschia sp. CCS1]ABD56042.1 ABC-1 [Jannaschia sp. CCS1]